MSDNKPAVIEETDRVQGENYIIKLENIRLQMQALTRDAQLAQNAKAELLNSYKIFSAKFREKYGVPYESMQIRPDGTYEVVGKTGAAEQVAQVLMNAAQNGQTVG